MFPTGETAFKRMSDGDKINVKGFFSRRERVCSQFLSSSNSLQINVLIKLDKRADAACAHLSLETVSSVHGIETLAKGPF